MAKQTFTTGQVLTAAQMTSLQQTAMGGGAATAKTASYVLVAADAGTTVAMNAAGSTTITVNSGLFAAGDTVFIQNLGAGACTVTAGTATVATAGSLILPQNDAGILYFTSASAAIFYDYIQVGATSPLTTKGDLYTFSTSDARLPVGANGTTLVADSAEATGLKWATPSSGGQNFTLLNAGGTALTAASTITVSFTAKDYLFVYIAGARSNTNALHTMRFNSDSGTNYPNQSWKGNGNSGGVYNLTNTHNASDTSFQVARTGDTNETFNSFSSIAGAKASGIKTYYGQSTSSAIAFSEIFIMNGYYSGTSNITSVSIISGSGNYVAGTIYVYGA